MGLDLLFRLTVTGKFRFDKGTLWIGTLPITILPTYYIAELTRYFLKRGELWKLYYISWIAGFYVVGKTVQDFKLDHPDKVYRFGMDLAELMGLGIYKTHYYDWKRYTYFEIPENPILEFLRDIKTDKPLDFFIAGAMAGGGSWVHEQPVQCIEMTCKLKGDAKCTFLTATEEELKKRNLWNYAREIYNLDIIYPIQKKIWKNRDEIIKGNIKILNKALDILD